MNIIEELKQKHPYINIETSTKPNTYNIYLKKNNIHTHCCYITINDNKISIAPSSIIKFKNITYEEPTPITVDNINIIHKMLEIYNASLNDNHA